MNRLDALLTRDADAVIEAARISPNDFGIVTFFSLTTLGPLTNDDEMINLDKAVAIPDRTAEALEGLGVVRFDLNADNVVE